MEPRNILKLSCGVGYRTTPYVTLLCSCCLHSSLLIHPVNGDSIHRAYQTFSSAKHSSCRCRTITICTFQTSLPSNLRRTTRECVYLVTVAYSVFCSFDFDLDPMTLTYELSLDILKTYLHTKNEVSRSRLSKVRARTGQTDTHRDRLTDATKHISSRFAGGN